MINGLPRVLVLSSAEIEERAQINNVFIAELQTRLHGEVAIEWHNYHDIQAEFATGELIVQLRPHGIDLKDFDFVYIKSYFRNSEIAGVVATYLELNQTPFICSELLNHIGLTKLTQLCRLSTASMPISRTIFMQSDQFSRSYQEIVDKLTVPFVFKAVDGSGGDENFLINNEEEFQNALNSFPDLLFIAQKFIANDSDLRVLIVGKKIELVIKRQRKNQDTHLNNTSQGADAWLVNLDELSAEDQELSLKAAEIMGREVAGVDLLYELNTRKPYILEVNASPQIASGAFMEEKLQIYSNYFKNVVKYSKNQQ